MSGSPSAASRSRWGPRPSRSRTHILSLDDAPDAYELFKRKEDGCVKVVLKP